MAKKYTPKRVGNPSGPDESRPMDTGMPSPIAGHEPESTQVEAPVIDYDTHGTTAVLGEAVDHRLTLLHQFGVKPSGKSGSTLMQVRMAVRHGFPREAFERLRNDLNVSTDELAEILDIPTRTLARRTDRFKPAESERLLRVGSVVQKAVAVLEDPVAARRWMTQPKIALGGLTPLRCCDTELGAREAEALLGRIEHGVFS